MTAAIKISLIIATAIGLVVLISIIADPREKRPYYNQFTHNSPAHAVESTSHFKQRMFLKSRRNIDT